MSDLALVVHMVCKSHEWMLEFLASRPGFRIFIDGTEEYGISLRHKIEMDVQLRTLMVSSASRVEGALICSPVFLRRLVDHLSAFMAHGKQRRMYRVKVVKCGFVECGAELEFNKAHFA